ncbi:futalosine hydrolase [Asinibacterium sp. OR53]|uniref:futalosine hydrolase n=1 Tax=Asinibacterium sp. OR53 TaxID=925409 RepID=UPI00047E2383|nr:futalosine hydrolase [Asinibacterium sp. OR53]
MRITITSATVGEWMPSFLQVNPLYTGQSHRLKLSFHQCGVGMLATAVSLSRLIAEEKPDLIIQAGIAGTFDTKTPLGKLVVVKDETLGDMGVQEDGRWKDIFDLRLEKSSYHPFEKRRLPNPWLPQFNLLKLPEVSAITVNEVTTCADRMEQLAKKYNPHTESMEGAALHYVCREANIPFIQVRAISNYVGERNKEHWKIKEAIDNLNEHLLKYIDKVYKIK